MTKKREKIGHSNPKRQLFWLLSFAWIGALIGSSLFFSHTFSNAQKALAALGTGDASATPIGTILAYAGDTPPNGWISCNGDSYPRSQYPKLHAAIQRNWGDGDDPGNTFRVPDLRGYFLRGRTADAARDPGVAPDAAEADRRSALHPGGATGSEVGSYQHDAVGDHTHEIQGLNDTTPLPEVKGFFMRGLRNLPPPNNTVSTIVGLLPEETRPKNVYVLFIIKAE